MAKTDHFMRHPHSLRGLSMHRNQPTRRKLWDMKKQDYVETTEYTEQQILDMMNLGISLKACVRAEYYPPLLRKKCIGLMLPDTPPLYGNMCATAIQQLGGSVSIFDIPLEPPESLRQTAEIISRTFDLVIMRCERHETLLALAKYATIPVVNAGSAFCAPVQELADLITMFEHLPREKKLETCKAVFFGGATTACASALYITSKIGMQFVQATPENAKELTPPQLKLAERNVKKSGGAYAVTPYSPEVFHGADFLFMEGPLNQKLPAGAEGLLRIDPNENRVAAIRSLLTCLLYANPATKEPLLIEKMKRMLAIKLQAIFGFGEPGE